MKNDKIRDEHMLYIGEFIFNSYGKEVDYNQLATPSPINTEKLKVPFDLFNLFNNLFV